MKATLSVLCTICLLSLLMMSCASTDPALQGKGGNDPLEENIAVDLTTRLKGYAGIRVVGNGAAAQIYARGINSISGSNQPLFILNGNQVPDYPELYAMVSTQSIKRIEVLVKPEEIAIYGVRGGNGVIKVTTAK